MPLRCGAISLLALPHPSTQTDGYFNLFGCEVRWEIDSRYVCCVEACTFQSASAQVESAQIGLPKVAIGEIDVGDIRFAQVDATKIATPKIARFARLAAPIEFLDVAFAQQRIQRIGWSTWFS